MSDIKKLLDEAYTEAYEQWSEFYAEAETDMRFYLGDQWTADEKRYLQEQQRSQYTFNLSRSVINAIDGYQRQHRLASVVTGVSSEDQKGADQINKLVYHAYRETDGYRQISACNAGALKTGNSLASVWLDYRNDMADGELRLTREPWNGWICDPYFTQMDFSDCNHLIRRRYIPAEMAKSLLPEHAQEIDELSSEKNYRDDKFTWLPYQRNGTGDYIVAYTEFWRQRWVSKAFILDPETGQQLPWEAGNADLKQLQALYPDIRVIRTPVRLVENAIFVNDAHIKTEINPFGLNEYPFVPFFAIWEPECDVFSLKMQSLIRPARDANRESNKRRSQIVDLIDAQINSGWIAVDGTVKNPESLYQSGQAKVLFLNKGANRSDLERIQPPAFPQGSFMAKESFDEDIKRVIGVNDATFGHLESGNESGVMYMLRQGASVTQIQWLMDNVRQSQLNLTKKFIKIMQGWSREKLTRILGEEPVPEFYDPDLSRYDLVISEGMLTDSQRQAYFRQLVDLKQIGEPIPPGELVRSAPIQGQSDLLQRMEEYQQQQEQQAQQERQVQARQVEAQINLADSQSLANLGTAKERQGRALSNYGLLDERAAQAVSDRSKAALDEIKAIKELEGIDLANLQKGLAIVRSLVQRAENEEQEIKEENIQDATPTRPDHSQEPTLSDVAIAQEDESIEL